MDKMVNWALERLSEKSTWLGIAGVVGSLGFALSPELRESFAAFGLAAVGLISIVLKEKGGE